MKSERSTYRDPVTGIEVTQLTNYKGHSHHFYFTNPGWYEGGRKLLFGSDRANRTNLFGLDLASGEIEQLTDIADSPSFSRELQFIDACKNPLRDEVYFWQDRRLSRLTIATRAVDVLWEADPCWHPLMINASADGRHAVFSLVEDVSDKIETDLLRGYVGFQDLFALRPLSRIVRVPTAGGPAETLLEERVWIGHVNTSPTRPDFLTYCHEGPWEKVDNRIWGLDLSTGRTWKIAPPDRTFHIGHEYWYQDGLRIGFHGISDGPETVIGGANFDGSGLWLAPQQTVTGHVFSFDDQLIIGDGYADGVIKIWKRIDGRLVGPRVLCRHDSTAKIQQLHVHPRLAPDGRSILFTSDRRTGYGNLYSVPLADFDSLPAWPL